MSGAARGPVRWHCSMSLDGYVAGPNDDMSFLEHVTGDESIIDRYVEETGAIIAGRRSYDAYAEDPSMKPYGGSWSGRQFVLTHHPEDARPVEGWTVLGGTLAQAVDTALDAARGKAVEIHSANIASQAIDAGLVDEIHVHIAPVILGQGVRFFDRPGPGPQVLLERVGAARPSDEVDLIFTPRR